MKNNRILSLVGISSGCAVIALVFSMINSSLPVIQSELSLPLGATQWMMSIFGIVNCAFLVTCGRLADIHGRKRVFLWGVVFSGIGMAGSGFCTSSAGLICCMGFAGLGNAIILPVSQALLISEFPEGGQARAIALWTAVLAAALAVGPVLGGLISSLWGWAWVFWTTLPVVLGSFLLVLFYSKESRNTDDPPTTDLAGMGVLGLMLASFVLLISEYPILSSSIRFLLAGSFLAGIFILGKIEANAASPIIQYDLLANRQFLAASLASCCLVFLIWSLFFLLPYYFQQVHGYSSLVSGLLMIGITAPVMVLSPFIARVDQRRSARFWILIGFALGILSFTLMGIFQEDTPPTSIFMTALLFGLAYSFIWGPSTTIAVDSIPKERAGIGTGTLVTIQEIGGTLGLALCVTLLRHGETPIKGFQSSMIILMVVGGLGCLAGALLSPFRTPLRSQDLVQKQ